MNKIKSILSVHAYKYVKKKMINVYEEYYMH